MGPYDMHEWFAATRELRKEPERGRRCSLCFGMRLENTFQLARDRGFDVVASTLSISPYKVTEQINKEGIRLSQDYSIKFLAENFKKQGGYETAKTLAKKCGIKHQTYCGCVYSKVEKILKLRGR